MMLEHVACRSVGIGIEAGGVAHAVLPTMCKAFNGAECSVSYRGNSILEYN